MKIAIPLSIITLANTIAKSSACSELDWPGFYNSTTIRSLHVKIKRDDLSTIQNDDTLSIEVPALFWDSTCSTPEDPILISIRRKSGTPIGGKLSYKLDINEYEGQPGADLAVKTWHGMKKLSLENGDDQDVMAEQLAWEVGTIAYKNGLYGSHQPGMANFAQLFFHTVSGGQDAFKFEGSESVSNEGVYVNVEQPDKQYMKNRQVWVSDFTWLYKQDDPMWKAEGERKEVGCEEFDPNALEDSPTEDVLSTCLPFSFYSSGNGKDKVVYPPCTEELISDHVDVDNLMTQAAIEAFCSIHDDTFSNGKNYIYVDYASGTCSDLGIDPEKKRKFFEWDLDFAFADINLSPYATGIGGYSNDRKLQLQENDKLRRGLAPGGGKGGGGGGGGSGGGSSLTQTPLQEVMFSYQTYLDLFNSKLDALTSTSSDSIISKAIEYLQYMENETDLKQLLQDDPNSKDAENKFSFYKDWLNTRRTIVAGFICDDTTDQTCSSA